MHLLYFVYPKLVYAVQFGKEFCSFDWQKAIKHNADVLVFPPSNVTADGTDHFRVQKHS